MSKITGKFAEGAMSNCLSICRRSQRYRQGRNGFEVLGIRVSKQRHSDSFSSNHFLARALMETKPNPSSDLNSRFSFRKNKNKIFKSIDNDLIDSHYDKLKADFEIINQTASKSEPYKGILLKIEALFNDARSWSNAYVMRRLMVHLYSPQQLVVELKDALAKLHLIKQEDATYACFEVEASTMNEDEQRACLGQLLTDIEQVHRKESLIKRYKREMTYMTALFFIASFPFFYIQSLFPEVSAFIFRINSHGTKGSVILTAIAAGWMGASFSMLLNLRKRLGDSKLEDLRVQKSFGFITSRIFIGIGAALILFYFFQASMLQGNMLPKLGNVLDPVCNHSEINLKTIVNQKDHASLIVWCFLAGFSESFVPALLSKTQESVQK